MEEKFNFKMDLNSELGKKLVDFLGSILKNQEEVKEDSVNSTKSEEQEKTEEENSLFNDLLNILENVNKRENSCKCQEQCQENDKCCGEWPKDDKDNKSADLENQGVFPKIKYIYIDPCCPCFDSQKDDKKENSENDTEKDFLNLKKEYQELKRKYLDFQEVYKEQMYAYEKAYMDILNEIDNLKIELSNKTEDLENLKVKYIDNLKYSIEKENAQVPLEKSSSYTDEVKFGDNIFNLFLIFLANRISKQTPVTFSENYEFLNNRFKKELNMYEAEHGELQLFEKICFLIVCAYNIYEEIKFPVTPGLRTRWKFLLEDTKEQF